MSTESMIRDVELAEEALPKKMGGLQNSRRCLCLSLFSFLLVAGATTLFCLLNFGVIGPNKEEKFPNGLPLISSMAQTLTLRSSSQNSSDKPVAHVVGKFLRMCLGGGVTGQDFGVVPGREETRALRDSR